MEWIQVLTIAGSTIGACWYMHRESYREMKDFHGRLCTLEEKYMQMMQRFLERREEERRQEEKRTIEILEELRRK